MLGSFHLFRANLYKKSKINQYKCKILNPYDWIEDFPARLPE
ncbi:MAG: hypothetical protein UX89_C0017G0007 [Parcubacteria group bacterium GW2011_GWA2_47_16]|nr:MAG: hypothetical protein UX89_C0017G0007 [Parcubacteria group bacterium GW2011_GWA2_47_16]